MQPDVKANDETEHRGEPILPPVLRPPYTVLPKGSGIYAHERNKGSEIEQFGASCVRHAERGYERYHAAENNVIAGHSSALIDRGKKAARDGVIAAHAEQQARCRELRRETGTNGRNQQCEV